MSGRRDGREHIVRLQIAVNDPFLVRGGETLRDLPCDVDRLAHRERTIGETFTQRLALEQLHHRVDGGALSAEIVNGEDMRVRQGRHRLGLTLEARQRGRIGSECGRQDLDRHVAIEFGVVRAVDLPHTAGADGRTDLIRAKASAGRERRHEWRT
jgi:hypothetical protein